MLAVATCHWNPAGWESLRRNYLRFRHEMAWWGVPTFCVELAYEGQEFASRPKLGTSIQTWRLPAKDEHRLWQKERLVNFVVERLPPEFDKVAWIDADVLFLDRHWPDRVVDLLERHPVVQLWDSWHCADAAGRVSEVLRSVGQRGERYIAQAASPGGAWAARREVFPLYDRHIVGSGDAMMVEAWLGQERSTCMRRSTPAMARHYAAWSDEAFSKVRGDIAVLPGHAIHLYHGTRAKRQYVDRWNPVIDADYDPATHVHVDDQGLLAWTASAPPALASWVRRYFASRCEDEELADAPAPQPQPGNTLPAFGGPWDGDAFPHCTQRYICVTPTVDRGYHWYELLINRWVYVGTTDTAVAPPLSG